MRRRCGKPVDREEASCIYFGLKTAAQRTFERRHGLPHLLKTTLAALKYDQAGKPSGSLLSFAKKG